MKIVYINLFKNVNIHKDILRPAECRFYSSPILFRPKILPLFENRFEHNSQLARILEFISSFWIVTTYCANCYS